MFGTTADALHAAGLQYEPPFRWTKERVIQAIQANRRPGVASKAASRTALSALHQIGCRLFGRWDDALAAAGFKPGHKSWAPEEVLRELRRHYPRYYPRSRIWTEVSGLASAARQQFGSRTNALIAAGLCDKSDRPRRRWTRQRVLEELRCQVGRGVPVTKIWQQDIGLHSAAIRLFGAWNEAVRAAGLQPKVTRYWNMDKIVQQLRLWHERGIPMRQLWKHDQRLLAAAYHHFGSLRQAVLAAGLELERQVPISRMRVIRELRARRDSLQSPPSGLNKELRSAISFHFGSLRSAMAAAGLKSKETKWSKQRVLTQIQDRYIKGDTLSRSDRRNQNLVTAARRYYGSWSAALLAAGLQPRNIHERGRKNPR